MQNKILMVTMGLDIGGAETHVVELSKELKRRGWDVLIASSGGAYAEEIEKNGIKHITVPLNDRKLSHMYSSYKQLKRLISVEKPDIVHAHARIPAFITGLVRKRLRDHFEFNFITTAHWVFNVTHLNRKLSNWGERTIAVSEDIKNYLIDEYDIRPEQISLTVNGIDTERFSPAKQESGIQNTGEENGVRNELGIEAESPVIAHVSRLDSSRALAARQLIEAAPQIAERIKGVRIIIAGDGDSLDELRTVSDGINASIGYRCVIMLGARTDIDRIVLCCDAFVGVSRAALEAMSAGKATVLAGNEGYIGIFNESRLAVCVDTNFCCRGCEASTADRLRDDLVDLLEMPREMRESMGMYGRKTVLDRYSVSRMTDDCEAVYGTAMKKRIRILMSGYYGFNNAGDEAILASIYSNIRKLNMNISVDVLMARAGDPKAKKSRIKAGYEFKMTDRFNPFKVIKAVRNCDVLISGGGSLLQDSTSTKSLFYYVVIMRMAKFFDKKLVMYANGIGPVNRPVNRKRVKKIADRADLITLRDENSAKELLDMGVTNGNFFVTADPVFSYMPDAMHSKAFEANEVLRSVGVPMEKPFVGVSVREWKNASPDFCQRTAEICDHIYEAHGRTVLFLVMQVPNDIDISRKIMNLMKNPSYIADSQFSTELLMGIVGGADLMICMRLHTMIFAANMGVPTMGLVYDPKVRDYLKMLGMPSLGDVDSIDVEEAKSLVDDMIEKLYERSESLKLTTDTLRMRSGENMRLLEDFLNEL